MWESVIPVFKCNLTKERLVSSFVFSKIFCVVSIKKVLVFAAPGAEVRWPLLLLVCWFGTLTILPLGRLLTNQSATLWPFIWSCSNTPVKNIAVFWCQDGNFWPIWAQEHKRLQTLGLCANRFWQLQILRNSLWQDSVQLKTTGTLSKWMRGYVIGFVRRKNLVYYECS